MKKRLLIVMALVLILTLAGMFLPRGVAYASPGELTIPAEFSATCVAGTSWSTEACITSGQYEDNSYRTGIDFDTSDIPDGATITKVELKIYVSEEGGSGMNNDVAKMTSKAKTYYDANNYSGFNTDVDGNEYLSDSNGYEGTGSHTVELSAAAKQDLQDQLGDDWFSVGWTGTTEADNKYRDADTWEEANPPQIIVTYTAPPAAPIVTNSTGASDVTHNSARLNGELTQGSPDPTVHIYWGDEDGGTTPGSWDNDEDLGTKPVGGFYKDITGLTAEKTYYYRCYATNSEGSDWADSTAQFTTTGTGTGYLQVGAGSDDASEKVDGSVKLDREVKVEGLGWCAFRWTGVNIPSGATITLAYVTVYTLKAGEDYLSGKTGYCQNANNPGTFTTDTGNISNRTRTTNSFPLGVGQCGVGWQQLPSMVDEVQEVVDDQGGTGDAFVFIIGNAGSTKLKMQSYDNDTSLAAKLHIEYAVGGPPKVGTQIGAGYPITISPSAMTPQEQWTTITVPVQDADTLADVNEVQVKLFYDSAGTDPDQSGFSADVQTCAILTWTRGGAPWTIAPGSTTWAVDAAGCSKPADSATQGDWVFSFKVGKVATHSTHSPGSDDWDIYAKATDAASDTGEDYLRDKEVSWYGEITVNTAGVDWGTVGLGSGFTDDTTNRVDVSVTYICNGNFNKQIKASSPWGSSPTITLNASGSPGGGEFALKADDDLTLDGAALVSTSYATFGTGSQTDESGTTDNGIWLKTGSSGITGGVSYDGTIYYAITQ